MDFKKNIYNIFDSMVYDRSYYEIVSDFFEMSAIAIRNAVDLRPSREMYEERYLQTAKHYKPEQLQKFSQALAILQKEISSAVDGNAAFADWAGEIYMESRTSNSNFGQFFTPYHVSKVVALCGLDISHITAKIAADFRSATLRDACVRNNKNAKNPFYSHGARWVWEAAEGNEVESCPIGYWQDHVFHSAAVAQTVWTYYRYTGDLGYLKEKGYDVLRECALFFRRLCVQDMPDGTSFVTKCTDLERMGPGRDHAFMTTPRRRPTSWGRTPTSRRTSAPAPGGSSRRSP